MLVLQSRFCLFRFVVPWFAVLCLAMVGSAFFALLAWRSVAFHAVYRVVGASLVSSMGGMHHSLSSSECVAMSCFISLGSCVQVSLGFA